MHLIKRLHKKKEKKFIPTKYHVKKWFDIINMYIFNFQLTPFDKIKIKNMKNWWACVVYDADDSHAPMHLHINKSYPSLLHFVTILAHEMVHKWQIQIINDNGNHNKHFYSWRPLFKKNGLKLNRKG